MSKSSAFRFARFAAAVLLAAAASYASGCSSKDDHHAPSGVNADVVYQGGTNDEALDKLLAAKISTDASKAPAFTAPADAAKLPAATVPEFAWKPMPTGQLRWIKPRISPHATPFGPERSAYAHGAPVNGRTFLLVFSTPGNTKVLRVFTTATRYKPDDASWGKLKSAGGVITATLTTAMYDNNNLVQDGGPFAGPPIKLEVQ